MNRRRKQYTPTQQQEYVTSTSPSPILGVAFILFLVGLLLWGALTATPPVL